MLISISTFNKAVKTNIRAVSVILVHHLVKLSSSLGYFSVFCLDLHKQVNTLGSIDFVQPEACDLFH